VGHAFEYATSATPSHPLEVKMRRVPQPPVVLLSYFTLRDLGTLLDAVRRSGIAEQADLQDFAVFNFRFGNASPQVMNDVLRAVARVSRM
jgi:hypothetical protein